jgi:hypothetical protein
VDVVDDLLADVHRGPVVLERELDRLDGALDPGAIAAGRSEKDALDHPEDRSFVRSDWDTGRPETGPVASGGRRDRTHFQCVPRKHGSHRPVQPS